MFIVHVRKQIKVLNWGTHRVCAKNQTKHHHHHHNYHITHQPEKPLSKSSWLRLKIYNSVLTIAPALLPVPTVYRLYPKVQTIFLSEARNNVVVFFVHILLKQQLLVCFLFRKQYYELFSTNITESWHQYYLSQHGSATPDITIYIK